MDEKKLTILEQKRKEQREVNKFNKSKEGKELERKVKEAHNQERIKPEDVPF